jgi:hypothetical protein
MGFDDQEQMGMSWRRLLVAQPGCTVVKSPTWCQKGPPVVRGSSQRVQEGEVMTMKLTAALVQGRGAGGGTRCRWRRMGSWVGALLRG